MTTKILHQEFHFEDTADSVRVKTVAGREFINEAALVTHARHFRLGAGTIIKVQVMSKDYDVLLHAADFVIERSTETIRRIVDERGERSARIMDFKISQDSEWKSYSAASEEAKAEPERVSEEYVPGEAHTKWNVGKDAWDVIVAGEVWTTVNRNEGEGKEDFKARALSIAAGSAAKAA